MNTVYSLLQKKMRNLGRERYRAVSEEMPQI